MKLTLQDLQDSFQVLARLAQQQPTRQMMQAQTPMPQLSGKTNWRLSRVWRDAQREFNELQLHHVELIKKHGGVETAPDYWQLPQPTAEDSEEERQRKREQAKAFQQEYSELLKEEIELWPNSLPLAFAELEQAGLTPAEWALLHWMVAEPEESQEASAPMAAAASGT